MYALGLVVVALSLFTTVLGTASKTHLSSRGRFCSQYDPVPSNANAATQALEKLQVCINMDAEHKEFVRIYETSSRGGIMVTVRLWANEFGQTEISDVGCKIGDSTWIKIDAKKASIGSATNNRNTGDKNNNWNFDSSDGRAWLKFAAGLLTVNFREEVGDPWTTLMHVKISAGGKMEVRDFPSLRHMGSNVDGLFGHLGSKAQLQVYGEYLKVQLPNRQDFIEVPVVQIPANETKGGKAYWRVKNSRCALSDVFKEYIRNDFWSSDE